MKEITIDALAAELTHAAYSVALKHETPAAWIDLELELWRVVRKTLQDRVLQGPNPRDAFAGLL